MVTREYIVTVFNNSESLPRLQTARIGRHKWPACGRTHCASAECFDGLPEMLRAGSLTTKIEAKSEEDGYVEELRKPDPANPQV